MKTKKLIFVGAVFCAISSAIAESFLQPTGFPQTIDDLGFQERWDIIAKGYEMYDREYDDDGNCIFGCPYPGITLAQDQKDVDQATNYFADLIAQEDRDNPDKPNPVYNQTPSNEGNTPGNPVPPGGNNTQPSVTDNQNRTPDKPTPPNTTPNNQNTPIHNAFVLITPDENRNTDCPYSLPRRSPVTQSPVIINSDFGWRGNKFHAGIDINVGYKEVYATGGGKVVGVYNNPNSSAGRYIDIDHGHGIHSMYLHLDKTKITTGKCVSPGTLIAISGNTGPTSTGPHLDYRMYWRKPDGKQAYIDVLCPCVGNMYRNWSADTHLPDGTYTCANNAMNCNFKFRNCQEKEKRVTWRLQHAHCMTHKNSLLPGEIPCK